MTLALTFSLVLIALFISYRQNLGLEKDMVIGSVRAVIQLSLVGFVLKFVFNLDNAPLTGAILLLMVYNAAVVAAKRGAGIACARRISFGPSWPAWSSLWVPARVSGHLVPAREVIPISGMVVGNSMVALGLLYRNLNGSFKDRREEVEVKLCLGAGPREAARSLIRESIRTAMIPTIDSMKTLGIVQLPGMMTGLILAGTPPETAIKYQIMVMFMLTGAVTIAGLIASFWAYRSFFNRRAQLLDE
jgi:putative ABC transport system permease protein